jgi:hypothetical protein
MQTAVDATIKDGAAVPLRPGQLPKAGRALIMVLERRQAVRDANRLAELCGKLPVRVDAIEWQRRLRSEWDDRL